MRLNKIEPRVSGESYELHGLCIRGYYLQSVSSYATPHIYISMYYSHIRSLVVHETLKPLASHIFLAGLIDESVHLP